SAARGSPASHRRGRSPPRRRSGRLEAERSVNNGREAIGPVMAVAREAANTRAIPAHHQAVAVVLDLVEPERAGRWPLRLRRLARFDEAGGTAHDHGRRIGQRLQPRYWRRRRGRGGWIASVSPVLTSIADVNVARN